MYTQRMQAQTQSNFPFAPSRLPFFYGWVIVVVSALGIVFSIPGQTAGVAPFTDSLIAATGLSREWFSGAYTTGTLVSASVLPFGGALLDRYGVRVVSIVSLCALGVSLLLLSNVPNFIAWMDAGTASAFALMAAVFTLLRFSGQGMLTTACQTMTGRWFVENRGRASAVTNLIRSLAFAWAPFAITVAIHDASDWTRVTTTLAFVVAIVGSFVAFLFFRDSPEACGLHPDGKLPDASIESVPNRDAGNEQLEGATRETALRHPSFWIIAGVTAIQALLMTGITFHISDLGAEAGLHRESASAIFVPIGAVAWVAGFFLALAAERLSSRTLVVLMYMLQGVGGMAMAWLGAWQLGTVEFESFTSTYAFVVSPGLIVAAIGLGVSGGLFGLMTLVVIPDVFGRRALGAIQGAAMTIMVVASAIGPSAFALAHSALGSYQPALITCGIASLLGTLAAWFGLGRNGNARAY